MTLNVLLPPASMTQDADVPICNLCSWMSEGARARQFHRYFSTCPYCSCYKGGVQSKPRYTSTLDFPELGAVKTTAKKEELGEKTRQVLAVLGNGFRKERIQAALVQTRMDVEQAINLLLAENEESEEEEVEDTEQFSEEEASSTDNNIDGNTDLIGVLETLRAMCPDVNENVLLETLLAHDGNANDAAVALLASQRHHRSPSPSPPRGRRGGRRNRRKNRISVETVNCHQRAPTPSLDMIRSEQLAHAAHESPSMALPVDDAGSRRVGRRMQRNTASPNLSLKETHDLGRLQEHFPQLSREVLHQHYTWCSKDVNKAHKALTCKYGKGTGVEWQRSAHLTAPKLHSLTQTREVPNAATRTHDEARLFQSRVKAHEFSMPMEIRQQVREVLSRVDQNLSRKEDLAHQSHRMREQAHAMAGSILKQQRDVNRHHRQSNLARASAATNELHEMKRRRDAIQHDAVVLSVRAHNSEIDNVSKVDLHGLLQVEAEDVLMLALQYAFERNYHGEYTIIVGKGTHSGAHGAKLPKKLREVLTELGARLHPNESMQRRRGLIIITI